MHPLKGLFLVLKSRIFWVDLSKWPKQVDFLSGRTFPISPLVVRAEVAWHSGGTSSPELGKAGEREREPYWCLLDCTSSSLIRFSKNVHNKVCKRDICKFWAGKQPQNLRIWQIWATLMETAFMILGCVAFLNSAIDHTLHSSRHNLTFAVPVLFSGLLQPVVLVLFSGLQPVVDTHCGAHWLHPPLPTTRVAAAAAWQRKLSHGWTTRLPLLLHQCASLSMCHSSLHTLLCSA